MNTFQSLGIKSTIQTFAGDKIKIDRILNQEIEVHRFKIEQSKFKGSCLYLQIRLKGEMRVMFTGSVNLMDMIKQVPSDSFPFTTTIVKDSERYEFT